MNCIIVDDEPLAQKGLESFVKEVPFLRLAGLCDHALQAMDLLAKEPIDLMFLDIRMPKITGIDFLKSLSHPPLAIITTAYPDYALQGFELDVLDYLVKPIPFDRFLKAVHKAREYAGLVAQGQASRGMAPGDSFCFIRCDSRYEKVFFDDIIYVEALQNYVVIHTAEKRLITYLQLKSVEEHLPAGQFIQISKSFIIPVAGVSSITGNAIQVGAHSFTIGRPYREQVMEQLLNDKLIRRK